MGVLEKVAVTVHEKAALQRLRRLCLDDPEPKFADHILSFLAADLSVDILALWADESTQAAGLERLARAVSVNADNLDVFRPVGQVARAGIPYKKRELRSQFPAAMAAVPEMVKAGPLATWLRRFACYLLVRALDAVEDGVLRDENLYVACLTARMARQAYEHTRHLWLAPLISGSTGFFEFEADTLIRCRQARQNAAELARQPTEMTAEESFHTDEASPLRFYDALQAVLEHREWRSMDIGTRQIDPWTPLPPYPGGSSGSFEHIRALLDHPAGGTANIGQTAIGQTTVTCQQTNPVHSPKRKERLGTKVRLEQVVESLFLPWHWSHLSSAEEDSLRARAYELLSAGQLPDRLGAALTLIGQVTSSSMHDIEALPLRSSNDHVW